MYQTRNVTFRCYEIHAGIIDQAAAKAGKTLSDYVRDIMIPWAASDLGVMLPPMPKLERGRYHSMVEQAAKKAGLTREQFERRAAEQAAADALGVVGPNESGEHAVLPVRATAVDRSIPARPERRAVNGRYASNGASSGNSER